MIKKLLHDLMSPVLSDKAIKKYNKKGILLRDPLDPKQIQPNSVDLTLSRSYKMLKGNHTLSPWNGKDDMIDPKKEIEYREADFLYEDESHTKAYLLMPGEFVLFASREVLNIPNGILAFVQGRSSIARLGIQTEQAGLIDAGFQGSITFEVYNESNFPIYLYEGMRVAQLYFFKAQYAELPYGRLGKGSKYQNQIEPTGSRIHLDFEHK